MHSWALPFFRRVWLGVGGGVSTGQPLLGQFALMRHLCRDFAYERRYWHPQTSGRSPAQSWGNISVQHQINPYGKHIEMGSATPAPNPHRYPLNPNKSHAPNPLQVSSLSKVESLASITAEVVEIQLEGSIDA